MASLASIQIGLPATFGDPNSQDAMQRQWHTAFYKQPVLQPVTVTSLGIVGDGVADPKHHGGIDKAILAYSSDHYPYWRDKLNNPDVTHGAFGENFSIQGMNEVDVCIGDQFQMDTIIVEVSQPREPCWKLGRRWQEKLLPKFVVANGFTGWYLRVLQEGSVEAGVPLQLIARPFPQWTIARCNDLLYGRENDSTAIAELFLLPKLSASWKKSLG